MAVSWRFVSLPARIIIRGDHQETNPGALMVNARAIRQLVIAPLLVVIVGALGVARAQPTSGGPVDSGIIDDLVTANRILAIEGVLDGLGHVSIRHPGNPDRYLLARSLAPALITAADVMEYDLDSNPIDQRGRAMFLERFIHGEAYKARPDVKAVIHSHSPTVIPFSISQTPLQPVFNGAAFLSPAAPVFEIRKAAGMTDGLVSNGMLGKALAGVLGDRAVALMRGHGNVVVGPAVQVAVYRAVYTELNARLQLQAISLGGPLTYLAPEEAAKINARAGPDGPGIVRTWELWKRKALGR
jgi:ribulose-5-phosphate 4-epimerase/fuculose-1-phosphate aldolase